MKTLKTLAAAAVALVAAATAGNAQTPNSLKVVNNCPFTIWIQQDQVHQVPNTPLIQQIASQDSYNYSIPLSGVQSTRFWPKTGCDGTGNNCKVGQTEPPCPGGPGCSAPVDSKIEVTWGCLGGGCGGVNDITHFDLSQVDGFTLPYSVKLNSDDTGPDCKNAACPAMDYRNACPTNVDLSTNGAFPDLKNQDLRVVNPNTQEVVGCFSPCGKLTFAKTWGGYNYKTNSPRAGFYCCQSIDPPNKNPIPSLDPGFAPGCRSGPAPNNAYIKFIENACNNQVYGYAYDDVKGNRACKGSTKLVLKLCP